MRASEGERFCGRDAGAPAQLRSTLDRRLSTRGSRAADLRYNAARLRVGDALLLTVVMVDELRVFEAEEVEQGGVIIVRADRVRHGLVPELVGFAVDHAAFKAAAGHPGTEALAVVVAAGFFSGTMIFRHG